MADATNRILACDEQFRLVRCENPVRHVLEKRDGTDALGVPRWKEINVGDERVQTATRFLRDWVVIHALNCPQMAKESE